MTFVDPWFADGQSSSPIDTERRLYEHSGNPVHAWRAFGVCLELMRTGRIGGLPAWLIDYFENLSDAVREVYYDSADKPLSQDALGERLAAALRFRELGQGVRRDAFQASQVDERDRTIAWMVYHRREQTGSALEIVIGDVVDQLASSAAEFDRLRALGLISPGAQAMTHQIAVSESTVWRAWRKWRPFIDEWRKRGTQDGLTPLQS